MTIQRKTALAFVVLLIVFGITHFATFPGSLAYFKQVTGGKKILDLEPEFDSASVYQRLESFGEEGRQAYLQLTTISDIVFPLSAFIFLLFLGQLARSKIKGGTYAEYYWLLPLLYFLADLMENVSAAILVLNYPEQMGVIPSVLGYISVVKRLSMALAFFVPTLIIIYAAWPFRPGKIGSGR